jgi:hypothetical protein
LVAEAVRVCRTAEQYCPDTGTLRGDLIALMEVMAASMKSEDGPVFAGLVIAMMHDPELAAELRSMTDAKRRAATMIHSRAVSRGELSSDSDANLIEEIAPAQMFMQCFARGEPLDAAFIDHLVDDILIPVLRRRPSGD